jgi:hypothetical protein
MNLTGHVTNKLRACESMKILHGNKNTNEKVFSLHEMPKVYHVYKTAEETSPYNTIFEIMVSWNNYDMSCYLQFLMEENHLQFLK